MPCIWLPPLLAPVLISLDWQVVFGKWLVLGEGAMNEKHEPNAQAALPVLSKIGFDLLHISTARLFVTLASPFLWCAAYFAFASSGWWPMAVLALVALSFVTYGSTSHDLVHRSLGLPKIVNDILLCLIEG